MSARRVGFDSVVVFDEDGALTGVEMTCRVCGDMGYKDSDAIAEHALIHLSAPYLVCGECGHVYWTEEALRNAFERIWMADEPFDQVAPPAVKIFSCPECSHDF
jgi:uncharacterized protein with PIN domain